MKSLTCFLFALFLSTAGCSAQDEWTVLFDGSSMDGWRASENSEAWVLEEVRAGRPTIGLYPPDDDARARYAARSGG